MRYALPTGDACTENDPKDESEKQLDKMVEGESPVRLYKKERAPQLCGARLNVKRLSEVR
jgi:hypothetical protein